MPRQIAQLEGTLLVMQTRSRSFLMRRLRTTELGGGHTQKRSGLREEEKMNGCKDCREWRDMYLGLLEEHLRVGQIMAMKLATEERLEEIRIQGSREGEKQ